ncbi:MAG: DUF305 domain-containing protein [Acidimicrobiia bacterium]|nr:DUF305 domain-containing protein [Acidimicrobiia bacterium]
MKKTRTASLALGLVLVTGVGLGACSSDHSGMSGMSSSTTIEIPANANYNATDIGFAQGMIPHHAQAIEMADLALTNTKNPDVLVLANKIKAAQSPEIVKLSGWLRDWGQTVPSTASGSMDHDMSGMGGMMMDGMMSQADMDRLETSTGTEFDRLWIELMIQHHEGAVKMSKTEVAGGKNPDAIALAQAIISSQQAEITTMESLLKKMPA